MTTPVNKTTFTILKVRQTMSSETNPDGAIKIMHTHTPTAQLRLRSRDDLRRVILRISGIFHNGKATAAIRPMICKKSCIITVSYALLLIDQPASLINEFLDGLFIIV